jgi:Arc/MetJ-type ribon-helix-helix transcriptional regulator
MPQKEGVMHDASIHFACPRELRDRVDALTDGGRYSRGAVVRAGLEGGGLAALERSLAKARAAGVPWRPRALAS